MNHYGISVIFHSSHRMQKIVDNCGKAVFGLATEQSGKNDVFLKLQDVVKKLIFKAAVYSHGMNFL